MTNQLVIAEKTCGSRLLMGIGKNKEFTEVRTAIAMDLTGVDILINTAIASANNPVLMAPAMKKEIKAGRKAHLAGVIPKKLHTVSPIAFWAGMIA